MTLHIWIYWKRAHITNQKFYKFFHFGNLKITSNFQQLWEQVDIRKPESDSVLSISEFERSRSLLSISCYVFCKENTLIFFAENLWFDRTENTKSINSGITILENLFISIR